MADIKEFFATDTALTWGAAIASSATVCRQSTAIDNTTTLYDDIELSILTTFPNSAPANDSTVFIMAGAWNPTNGFDGSPALSGTDGSYTLDGAINTVPHALKPIGSLWQVQNVSRVWSFRIASAFSGVCPAKVAFVACNFSGQTLTTFTARWRGIYFTVT